MNPFFTLPQMPEPYGALRDAIQQMLLQYRDVFVPAGLSLFQALAVILLAVYGLKTAFGGADHGLVGFARLVMTLTIGYTLITFYSTPIPGLDTTLPDLVLAQVTWAVERLHTSAMTDLFVLVDSVFANSEEPGLTDVVGALVWVQLAGLCALLKFGLFFIVAFGVVATAVLIVLGPLFLPWMVVPGLDFLFWAWLRSFLVYASYQLIAEAYFNVWISLCLRILEPFRQGMDLDQLISLYTYLLMIILTFIVGTFKLPSLCASLFAGRGGEGTAGDLLRVAMVAVGGRGRSGR